MEVFNFVVAIFVGALIGFQREFTQQKEHLKRFAGFRTFIIITLLGAVLGFLGKNFDSLAVIIGFIWVIILVLVSYILTYIKDKTTSIMTEIAAVFSYILGVMCTIGYVELAVIFGIILAAFLAFKDKFHRLAKKIKGNELIAVIEFALISFVVLPLLPNRNYSPMDVPGLGNVLVSFGLNSNFLYSLDVFNFYKIWLMVILVAGISFLGYFLSKILGSKKSYGILGFVGGLVSSTAVTLSMAGESKKKEKLLAPFVLATVIAASVMFIRIIFEVAIVNSSLLGSLIFPLGVMALVGFGAAFLFYKKSGKSKKPSEEVNFEQPFALKPALKFGGFFLLVILVSRIAQLLFGEVGIYVTSALSGLADVDAITLSVSNLSKAGSISNFVATTSIFIAMVSNTLVKAGLAMMLGNKKYGRIVLGCFLVILLIGLLVLLI
jgi:uncharacterized membrane protein (DUF4010 family)